MSSRHELTPAAENAPEQVAGHEPEFAVASPSAPLSRTGRQRTGVGRRDVAGWRGRVSATIAAGRFAVHYRYGQSRKRGASTSYPRLS